MRLTDREQFEIKNVIAGLDSEAKVYLFGSRADDNARGGDIDLLIYSEKITERDQSDLRIELFERLGEQKIDLIITKDLDSAFVRLIYGKGVEL